MVSQNDLKAIKSTSIKAVKAAKAISGSMGKTSITRLAKDSIFQYPHLISADIPTDEAITLTRASEKYNAAMLVSVFSLRTVDLNKNDDIAQYLKRFHNNSNIPSNVKAASTFVFESVDVSGNITTNPLYQATESDIMACWSIVEEQVDMESLNDVYRPYDKTKNIISNKIQILQTANEAVKDVFNNKNVETILQKAGSMGGNDSKNVGSRSRDVDRTDNTETTTSTRTLYDKNGNVVIGRDGKPEKDVTITTKTSTSEKTASKSIVPNTFNAVIKSDKLSALEPTMMNVQFVVHGGEGDNKQFVQNVVLGVKAMVRLIRSDVMVANMIEASKNSNFIFKFIKWTKGEFKFVKDLIFNVSEIKDSAIAGSSDKNFIRAIKRRGAINNVTKFFDNRIPPITTIVMTSYEVARVAEATGVDLSEVHNALNLLNKYYLLSFGIYDTETKILSMLFDGEDDFAETSIESLRAATPKNSDLVSMSDAMKIFGRV